MAFDYIKGDLEQHAATLGFTVEWHKGFPQCLTRGAEKFIFIRVSEMTHFLDGFELGLYVAKNE